MRHLFDTLAAAVPTVGSFWFWASVSASLAVALWFLLRAIRLDMEDTRQAERAADIWQNPPGPGL